MSEACELVVLRLDNQHYGLRLHTVERVIQAIEVSALPGAPASVMGVVNVQGEVIPVFDLRQRFGLPEQALSLGDQIVLARAGQRVVGVCVDLVEGVASYPEEQVIAAETLAPGIAYVKGVVKLPDGLILIHDLDTFLSSDEAQALDGAL